MQKDLNKQRQAFVRVKAQLGDMKQFHASEPFSTLKLSRQYEKIKVLESVLIFLSGDEIIEILAFFLSRPSKKELKNTLLTRIESNLDQRMNNIKHFMSLKMMQIIIKKKKKHFHLDLSYSHFQNINQAFQP
eukprot:c21513_g1_i1.p1 GENE.c21513_g1_i1~~c21513_g1_i1.p1  ORF type:complete len:132 (-),score=8.12 c21513_g1_i1:93-488(-)